MSSKILSQNHTICSHAQRWFLSSQESYAPPYAEDMSFLAFRFPFGFLRSWAALFQMKRSVLYDCIRCITLVTLLRFHLLDRLDFILEMGEHGQVIKQTLERIRMSLPALQSWKDCQSAVHGKLVVFAYLGDPLHLLQRARTWRDQAFVIILC
jgi:hypothetical protein